MGTLFILLLASACLAQQPAAEAPVFRAGVSYVRVDAQVVEGRRVIAGLARQDFEVYDEGALQSIEYFGRDSEPLWVALLLDVSGSMRKRLSEMATVARQALGVFSAEDHMAVIFFGRTTRIAQEFTPSMDEAAAAVGEATRERSVGSGTAINAAVLDAARYVRGAVESKRGRRAVVILTDNAGLNYQIPDEAVLGELFGADTVLNAIVTPNAKPPAPPKPGLYVNPDFTPSDVFRLARETGGEVLRAERAGEAFREMMERIRTRYSLHYRAPEARPGQVRKIRVELSPAARQRYPKAEVRARSGYAVPN